MHYYTTNLIAERINAGCDAIENEARRFVPAMDRRSYTGMDANAAAEQHAHDQGVADHYAEQAEEQQEQAIDDLISQIKRDGFAGLSNDQVLDIQCSDERCIVIANQIVIAVMAGKWDAVLKHKEAMADAAAHALIGSEV